MSSLKGVVILARALQSNLSYTLGCKRSSAKSALRGASTLTTCPRPVES
jgi:hypothetical protein